MLTQSSLAEWAADKEWNIVDQCMYGAKDEEGQPIRKSTTFVSNMSNVKMEFIRCDRMHDHGVLRGRAVGALANRTTIAAVCPTKLCNQILNAATKAMQGVKVCSCSESLTVSETCNGLNVNNSCENLNVNDEIASTRSKARQSLEEDPYSMIVNQHSLPSYLKDKEKLKDFLESCIVALNKYENQPAPSTRTV